MAGEWIAVDISLPDKPEVQELIDLTDCPVEVVIFRLYRLWAWASMNCADGTARMTLTRLVRTCGGDEDFWRAVVSVGWLELDETAATVAVPGWDRRFSQAAKARLQHRDRAAAQETDRGRLRSSAGTPCAQAQGTPAPPRRRGDERREEFPPPPREDAEAGQSWERFRGLWNDGATPNARRRPWKPAGRPEGVDPLWGDPEWLSAATEAIRRLAACRYFDSPVTLIQFLSPGFVQRVLGGQYDTPKTGKGSGPQEGPPPRVDPAFEAARKATLAREEAKRQAEHRKLDIAASSDDIRQSRKGLADQLREGVA